MAVPQLGMVSCNSPRAINSKSDLRQCYYIPFRFRSSGSKPLAENNSELVSRVFETLGNIVNIAFIVTQDVVLRSRTTKQTNTTK